MLSANKEHASEHSRPKTKGNRTDATSPNQPRGGDYESNDPQNRVESVQMESYQIDDGQAQEVRDKANDDYRD